MQQVPHFQAQAITLKRQERTLLQDISFSLQPGNICQIVGVNGAGKTSLLKCLCGLLKPESGVVSWDGKNIQANRYTFQAELLYLSDKVGIKGHLTPKENLKVLVGLRGKQPLISIEQALENLGLTSHADRLCKALSAGQLRRVMLARLLLEETRLWLLDEPFIGLDQQGIAFLQEILTRFIQHNGMVIFTSHQAIALHPLAIHKVLI